VVNRLDLAVRVAENALRRQLSREAPEPLAACSNSGNEVLGSPGFQPKITGDNTLIDFECCCACQPNDERQAGIRVQAR
jgi:hypothetical protein